MNRMVLNTLPQLITRVKSSLALTSTDSVSVSYAQAFFFVISIISNSILKLFTTGAWAQNYH